MRVNDDYKEYNAEAQRSFDQAGELSIWQFWKRGLENRKKHKDVFVYGKFELDEAFVVVLNISGGDVEWEIPESIDVLNWVTSNYDARGPNKARGGKIGLRPWEGILGTVKV